MLITVLCWSAGLPPHMADNMVVGCLCGRGRLVAGLLRAHTAAAAGAAAPANIVGT